MTLIDQLLSLSTAFQGATGLNRTTLSWRLFGDTKKLDALFTGADIQTKRFEGAVGWFATHWPEGVDWPESVERPHEVAA